MTLNETLDLLENTVVHFEHRPTTGTFICGSA